MRNKKTQFATEYVMLFSFAFLIFLILISIIIIYLDNNQIRNNTEKLDAFGESIKKNIILAQKSGEEFNIEFHVPDKIDDTNINITIDANTLVIINTDTNQSIMKNLPAVTGNFEVGKCNKIYKKNNIINIEIC
jgi:hypothetical protein